MSREINIKHLQIWPFIPPSIYFFAGYFLIKYLNHKVRSKPHKTELGDNLRAYIVIGGSKKSNNTGGDTGNLPGKLASNILAITLETQETAEGSNGNGVSDEDWVVAVGLQVVLSILCLLLCLGSLCLSLLLELGLLCNSLIL